MKKTLMICAATLFCGLTICAQTTHTKITVKSGREALQKALGKAAKTTGDVELELVGGEYCTDKTIEISAGKWTSLHICAKPGETVTISGDKIVPAGRIRPVSDPTILSLLRPEMRGKVMEADCRGLVSKLDNIRPSGFGRKSLPAWSELIINNEPLNLSRWPNESMELIGKVEVSGDKADKAAGRLPVFHYSGKRPSGWKRTDNMWIAGYFGHGYADDMLPVKSINPEDSTIHVGMFTTYQFFTGADFRRWFAVNLIEELDRPGEYVIDTVASKFYFLPPAEKIESVRLTVLNDPVVAIEGCKNVTIENITIQNSKGIGIYMDNTENVTIRGCTIRNLGNVGVCIGKGTNTPAGQKPTGPHAMEAGGELQGRMVGDMMGKIYEDVMLDRQAGRNNGVKDCHIYNTGAGGVSLGGNGRATLRHSGNYVENCRIHRYNRIEKSYRPAVWIDGVGNRVSQCDIYDAPSMAILFHGNEHTIELCKITNVCQEVDDQGAIYYGRDPSERGHVIRYNYFHELSPRHRVTATYHDDGACGSEVYGNIYHRAGSMPVLIGGGMDHHYHHNIFIDTPLAIHIDNRLQNWAAGMIAPDGIYRRRLAAVRYNEPPYSTAYPRLPGYWQDNPALPKRNVIEGNLFYKVRNVLNGQSQWGEFYNNWITDNDPGFTDPADPLKGFRSDAEIYKRIPGFPRIPFNRIGCTLK